ncbi:translation initiation factor IF-2-like [Corvus cornix cornix]|uniref:translation initiation factor IF-2-like n=1 Tax=Corvus cornix cornix TaxID=932674 RepID=UPI00194FBF20|nr:translation initiation factor IF-2-like [Corvus cornix cornix]
MLLPARTGQGGSPRRDAPAAAVAGPLSEPPRGGGRALPPPPCRAARRRWRGPAGPPPALPAPVCGSRAAPPLSGGGPEPLARPGPAREGSYKRHPRARAAGRRRQPISARRGGRAARRGHRARPGADPTEPPPGTARPRCSRPHRDRARAPGRLSSRCRNAPLGFDTAFPIGKRHPCASCPRRFSRSAGTASPRRQQSHCRSGHSGDRWRGFFRTEGNSIATSEHITSALAPGRASILTSSGPVAFSLFPLPLPLSGRARSEEALLIIP